MSKHTDAIYAMISALDAEMHAIETKRRELLYAVDRPGGDPLDGIGELADLSGKMTALQQRRGGLADLLDQARARDRAEELKAKEAQILQHVSDGCAALDKRTELGAKVDSLVADLGELLCKVQAVNDEAAEHFSQAMRMTPAEPSTKGNLRVVISDFVNGKAVGGAFASKLRARGVGETGIPVDVIWNYGTMGADESVAEAMEYAKQKVETTFGFWLATCIAGVAKPEPMPSRLAGPGAAPVSPAHARGDP